MRPLIDRRSSMGGPRIVVAVILLLAIHLSLMPKTPTQAAGPDVIPSLVAPDDSDSHRTALRRADPEHMIVDECFLAPPPARPLKGFTAYGGRWRVQDGVLLAGPGDGPKLICQQEALTRGEVGVEILLPDRGAGNAGLIVKVSQPGEGADRFTGYEISLDAASQTLRLGRHRQNFEHLKDVPCPVPDSQWIALEARLSENSLEVLVAGKTVLTYVDREHPLISGTIGLRPWQREARYRNLWIRTQGAEKKLAFELEGSGSRAVDICGHWRATVQGSAQAAFAIRPQGPWGARQSQQITFLGGQGEVGIEYCNLSGAGLFLDASGMYEGCLWARCDKPAEVFVTIGSDEVPVLAESPLRVLPGDWQRLRFSLTPRHTASVGRLAIKLRSPGSVTLGRISLHPGDWAWPESLSLKSLPRIAVLVRHPLTAPPAIGCDIWASHPRAPGCALRLVDPAAPDRPAATVFEDPQGCIYDMNVSYDARTLYFSYRGQGEEYWHLWRVNTDGTGLKQLTSGPFYDISPCLLPDGDLVFVSTRRFGHTVCQPGPASNLFRMAPDGTNIRCVSMNTLSDFSPQMLPDGRVLFTRWEYVDRDLTFRQSLWTQNPDGTAYQLYFGNTIRDVGTFWQARPLPGRVDQVIATFAPHHGFPHGAIGLIDRSWGVEGPHGKGYVWITKEFPEIGDSAQEWSYRDPYPLSDRTFLCAYGGGGTHRFRIFLADRDDHKRLLYEDPQMSCYCPLPLKAVASPPVIASRLPQPGQPEPRSPSSSQPATQEELAGSVLLVDVYRGLEPAIRRGQVKYLRVMEQIRKTEDLASRAFDQSPVMSYGTYYAKRCWGTVPVEEDGSAHFRVPALREVYFQVLDAQGRELQRMTSAVQLMPGERLSCIGCHEPRQLAPPRLDAVPLAARHLPASLEQPAWGNDGLLSFPKLVQPVLDKYCVECHHGADPAGGYDLSGDKTRLFSMAYDNLLGRSRSYRQHDMATGEMLPSEQAKGKALVHFFWLLRTPTGVNQPLWAGSHASRLLDYIEGDHSGQEIPPEDRQRVYLWIDANVPYYDTYAHSRPKSPGKRDLCTDVETGQPSLWFARDFLGVYDRRCAGCHGKCPDPNDHSNIWDGRLAWINFTNPSLSPALTAHLSREAGGRGIHQSADEHEPPIFQDISDPDYQTMLKAIQLGKKLAEEHPEADMPGFQGVRKEP